MGRDAELGELMIALVADCPALVLVVDREYRIRYLNRFEHGFTAEQVIGRPVDEYILEKDRARVREAVAQVLSTGETVTYLTGVDTPEGTTCYRTMVGPIRADGEVRYVSMISFDITAEHEAKEAAARELETRAALLRIDRALFAAAQPGEMFEAVLSTLTELFDCERAFVIYPCSPTASELIVEYEHTKADVPAILGQPLLMDEDFAERLRLALATPGEAVRHDPRSHPIATVAQDAERFGVRSMLSVAFQPHGDDPWYLAIHHCPEPHVYDERDTALLSTVAGRLCDALDRLIAQRALAQSEERFRLLVENAPEAIVIFDADEGRFVDANQQAVELFGMEREELLTKGPMDVSPPTQADGTPSAQRALAMIRAALEGRGQVFEWQHQNSAGEILECEIRLLRLPHPGRQWVRGSVTDISARKATERENERLSQQLAHAQKMQAVGQLTGGVAHDFNNLLTVIGSSIAMIELDAGDALRTKELTQLAHEACDRAAELTQRLLAFSRQQPLRPRSVHLGELIEGMEDLLRRTLGETIAIQTTLADDLWRCEVDPAQLENAILNLSINARDALPSGGCLTIEAHNVTLSEEDVFEEEAVAGDYVCLAVRDDGEGIPPDALPKVFEPFFTTKEVGEGSGLGLSMVYGFTKQSRGYIRITSEVGEGTTVELYLPRSDAPARTETPPSTRKVDRVGHGELILVVEDEKILSRLIADLLRRLGFEALTAENGPEALALVERHDDIALLLSDVVLPGGMNGADIARHVHQSRPDLPVLFMSGYTDDAVVHDGRLDEGVALLQKPFDLATLANAVEKALSGSPPDR